MTSLIALADIVLAALATKLPNISAVRFAAEALPRITQTAADAAALNIAGSDINNLHVLGALFGHLLDLVLLEDAEDGSEHVLDAVVAVNHAIVALHGVACADGVCRASVTGGAAAAARVALAFADEIAGTTAADGAGNGVVAPG